ncbi:MAG: outer membrane protein assembly factor BamD [Paludibacteraceae bacterium]|nr:outer membrane protein assembly factor BamD [Paludibacteraceae bacterium]
MAFSKYRILFFLPLILMSCSAYREVLKSKDPEYKYQKAIEYFNQEQYVKSQTLLDDVAAYFKGTERAQEVLIYLGRSYMGQKDYASAADYFQSYLRNYPKGKYATEALFQTGHCYYLDSPDARLDQEITNKAIKFLTQFIDTYADSPYMDQAYKELNEMYDKLAYKEYLNAKLYYNLGTYLGNNYLSCEIVAHNALKNYPSNSYQEELSWLIFMSKYQQLVHSVESKIAERLQNAEDEYYSFRTEFPDSKHTAQLEKIYKDIQKRK